MEIGLSLSLTGGAGPTGETARSVTVNNASGPALTDYQIAVPITWNAGMRPDFSDVRFSSDNGGATILSHWIETYSSGVSATAWVKVPSIGAAGSATIYLRYGNRAQAPTASGFTTFDLFDDFSSGAVNGAKWTTTVTDASQAVVVTTTEVQDLFRYSGATNSAQGLATDGTSLYLGKDNGAGTNGSVFKTDLTGTLLGTFAAPPHASCIAYAADRGTILVTSGGVEAAVVWEINVSTGSKLRSWDFSAVDYRAGAAIGYIGSGQCWIATSNNSGVKFRLCSLSDDGTFTAGPAYSLTNAGERFQATTYAGGQLYYVCDDSAGGTWGSIYTLTFNSDLTVTKTLVSGYIRANTASLEREAIAYDAAGDKWYYMDGNFFVSRLFMDGVKALRCFTSYATTKSAYVRALQAVSGSGVMGVSSRISGTYPAAISLSDTSGSTVGANNAVLLGRLSGADSNLYGRQRTAGTQTQQSYGSSTGFIAKHKYEIKWVSGASVAYFIDGAQVGTTITTNVPTVDLFPALGGETATSATPMVSSYFYVYVRKYAATEPTVTVN